MPEAILRFEIREARTPAEVERCRALAGSAHGLRPGDEPPEGWPERWLMGVGEGRLVATVGVVGREGCVHHFCGIHGFELAAALRQAGARELVELRMLAVDPAVRGFSFARLLGAAAYSRAFLAPGARGVAVLQLGPPRLFRALERVLGVHAQLVETDGRGGDARELRLLLIDNDVPPELLDRQLPAEIRAARRKARPQLGRRAR